MEIQEINPKDIEKKSFEIIHTELQQMGITLPTEEESITMRCIHTSADFDYAKTLVYSPDAINKARTLLRNGCHIVTDTSMAMAGINKKSLGRFGGEVHCFMQDEDVSRIAMERGVTRASVSMEKARSLNIPLIYAIGNAPTALVSLYNMTKEGYKPDFIIGVPVGFVNVVYSKELFLGGEIPYIINKGRKGGSNIAACICNALLYGL